MAAGRTRQNLELSENDKKEKQRTARALEKLGREATKHEHQGDRLLEMISSHGPKVSAKAGEISKELYTSGAINPQHGSPLARLTSELLLSITDHLPRRADQVALALTCKHIAAIDAAYRTRLNSNGNPKVYSKANKLEMLVRLRSWAPETVALCYQCLRFKAKNKANWTTNMDISASGLATQRALSEGPKCPRCTEWAVVQRGRDTTAYKRAAEKVKAVVKGSWTEVR